MHVLDQILRKLYGPMAGTRHHLSRPVGRSWAAVHVMAKKKGREQWLEIVPGEIVALRRDALIVQVPAELEVRDPDGEALKSERGGFYITTESIDPYHLVCDGLPGSDSPDFLDSIPRSS